MCWLRTTLLNTCNVKDVGYDELVALHGRCSVKLQQICLRTWYYLIKHASWSIGNQRESYLTDAPPSDMPINNVKLYQPRLLHCQSTYMSCRELLCRCSCNIYASWHSVNVTNTAAVQTCLLIECCCKMDACWTVATQSACLLNFCHSILHVCWRCDSLSAIPAGMVFTISRVCWCGASLYVMPFGLVHHYQPCLLVWCLTIGHAFWCGASL